MAVISIRCLSSRWQFRFWIRGPIDFSTEVQDGAHQALQVGRSQAKLTLGESVGVLAQVGRREPLRRVYFHTRRDKRSYCLGNGRRLQLVMKNWHIVERHISRCRKR